MGVLHGNPFLIASGTPTEPTFPLQRSLRFRSSAPAYFTRTPATTTNQQVFTWSSWMKLSNFTTADPRFYAGRTGLNFNAFSMAMGGSGGTIYVDQYTTGGALQFNIVTASVFRDPSAWYHLVIAFDTTQSVPSNRVKIYVNGVQITAFSGTPTYPSINLAVAVNTPVTQHIGAAPANSTYFDGYMTEVNFIDGQQLSPLSFGGYNPGTNVWEPRKYSGTYGTNGFYLNFQNPASTGADSSGNSNNWTPNNIQTSNSTLATYDSMLDVPTLSSGNNANFATLNQLRKGTGVTLSEANLTWSIILNNAVAGTIGVSSGKWYWEVTAGTRTYVGIVNESASIQNQLAGINGGYCYAFAGIKYSNGGTSASYGATYTSGDIIGAALDMDAGTITFYKNGVSQGVAFTGLSGIYFPATGSDSISTATGSINFGQRPFAYPIPSGHKMLNTFNLPEPTIPRGDKYFEQYLYTGNGGGQQVGEIQKPMSLFNLDRSLRFRASNSAYLNRTWGTPTDARKFTCSFWLKRGLLSGAYQPFGGGTAAANAGGLQFLSSDALNFYWENATNCNLVTTNVYKDPSLWYNIVVIQDTTQATAGNRLQIYVNGILQTLTGTYPAQNASATFNSATVPFGIMAGRTTSFGLFTDGYLGDFYWIDGQANAATSFGQFDGNNYWTPKAYTGTYGTNGFHLEFEDFSNNTATTIGKDTSGNGNNWTPTGISVTAGITYDSMKDVPTLTSTDTANYCTFNPLDTGGGSVTLSGGNLNYSIASSTGSQVRGTMGTDLTSKWYWEYTAGSVASPTNPQVFGISTVDGPITNNSSALKLAATIYTDGSTNYLANKVINGVSTSITTQFRSVAIGDILQVAYDAATGNLWFGKNNTWYDATNGTTGNPSTGTNPVWTLPTGSSMTPYLGNLGATYSGSLNCGQRPFIGTVPTGFKSLNSFNIAEVSGDVETADLVRIKSRSATTPALWFNSVSGAGKYILGNNNTAGEATDVNSLIQFNKNGLLIGNNANINTLSATYIADVWKAGDSTVTNTAGSITSQVRANPISGISVVTYTGNGISTATVGHGLGIQPAMVILKSRSLVNNWWVAHKGSPNSWLQLDTTGAAGTGGGTGGAINYQSTFTNSVFGFLNGSSNVNNVNQNLATYVAYCFLEIPGFSKFDSYISNGSSTDGPFVYTGFRPRWVMIKQRDVTRSWIMYDTTRNTFNVVDKYFFMEGLNNNEQTAALLDINSNGFKLKNNNVNTNTTAGQVYIYMAFAEHPFKYALAR